MSFRALARNLQENAEFKRAFGDFSAAPRNDKLCELVLKKYCDTVSSKKEEKYLDFRLNAQAPRSHNHGF